MKKLVFNLEGDLFNAAFPKENIYERTPLLLIICNIRKIFRYDIFSLNLLLLTI